MEAGLQRNGGASTRNGSPPKVVAPPDVRRLDCIRDMVDHTIDLMLNLRQSGHPGGSRSKVPALVALTLSGAMRWDIRRPEKRLADRFVLVAGHAVPAIYAMLAVYNEALRVQFRKTGDSRFVVPKAATRALVWEDLLRFRRRGGLPGHAEMSGKTLFLKFNTGPSGHGTPAAVGMALALKVLGAGNVKVFTLDGEAGLTAGVNFESRNAAWGYGLDNLVALVDWNDFGIDSHRVSEVVPGTPETWFGSQGFRVFGASDGENWDQLITGLLAAAGRGKPQGDYVLPAPLSLPFVEPDLERGTGGFSPSKVQSTKGEPEEEVNPPRLPSAFWFKTRKGRGYNKFDSASHGSPHSPPNCPLFWETMRPFCEKYGIELAGFGKPAPPTTAELEAQTATNLSRVFSLLDTDEDLCTWLAERLVALGDSIPDTEWTEGGTSPYVSAPRGKGAALESRPFRPGKAGTGTCLSIPASNDPGRRCTNPWRDPRFFNPALYPAKLWAAPGTRVANKAALGRWGAYVNALARREYGRPLFIAMSADLAESTNVAGFSHDFSPDMPGFGKFHRDKNTQGALLPAEITEFLNSGICAGMATVNFAPDPFAEWDGIGGVCSTYGSFSYLKYGPMRLLSQMAQDCELKLGKVIWVVGHSGPETADDSRTHFGIFAPGCTQLFPKGSVINCHPWEYNEVPVLLAAALQVDRPIVALHLTRPPITIPDRRKLGIPSHFDAARGAYILRDWAPGKPRGGTIIVQGTLTTVNVLSLLPRLDEENLNVRLVAATSAELFRLAPQEYREKVLPWEAFLDSTFITNQARICMQDWCASQVSLEYAMSADFDDRWRTGGTIEEVYDEAHLSPDHILAGIRRFVQDRKQRLERLRSVR